jgi:FkbM family methyltransferase
VIKLLKYKLKKYLYQNGWIIKKKYINESYTNQKPSKEFLEAIQKSNGIIHMGAHRGGEAAIYDWFQKKTIWIEADPKIFLDLEINISQFVNQKAFNALLYDKDYEKINFYKSNNDGASSSIFKLGKDSDKKLKIIEKKNLETITLDTLLKKNNLKVENYDLWIMDLQGSELLALQGAQKSLKNCNAILIEVSLNEQYVNGAKWEEIKKLLNDFNFESVQKPTNFHEDILFLKR